jgi:hypothetical protein
MPKASITYCKNTPIKKMGFTQKASCKAQGLIPRESKDLKGKYVKSPKYKGTYRIDKGTYRIDKSTYRGNSKNNYIKIDKPITNFNKKKGIINIKKVGFHGLAIVGLNFLLIKFLE